MADEPDNFLLVYLRRLDAKMERVIEDVVNMKALLTAIEEAVVRLTHRVDRLDLRMDRIEHRLDLVGMPHRSAGYVGSAAVGMVTVPAGSD